MEPKRVTTRRGFFWRAGAAASVPLAVIAGSAMADPDDDHQQLRARLAALEDRESIRELQRAYIRHLHAGDRDALVRLFAQPSRATFDACLRNIMATPADDHREVISLSPDGLRATACFQCRASLEAPIAARDTLLDMARLQGGGFIRRTEVGAFEGRYIKRHGEWKIAALSFRATG